MDCILGDKSFLHLIWYLQFTTLFSLTSLEINYMQVLSPIYKKRNKWPRMFFILLAIELVIYGTKSRRTELLGLSYGQVKDLSLTFR